MPLTFESLAGWKWTPDAEEIGAPEGTLLRADNTISDRLGSRSLRLGSEELYGVDYGPLGDPVNRRVTALHTADLQGTTYRMALCGDRLYVNGGEPPDAEGLAQASAAGLEADNDPDGSFGDDSYQIFFARGSNRLKYDGESLMNWGLEAPTIKPTLGAVDAVTEKVADCNAGELTGNDFVVHEGDTAYHGSPLQPVYIQSYAKEAPPDYFAMGLKADSGTGRASASRAWGSDTDFFDFQGNRGGDTDLFDMRIWLEEPRVVDQVTVMFGLDAGDDPFLNNYYYFDFKIRNKETVDLKDTEGTAANIYDKNTSAMFGISNPQDITNVKTPEQAQRVIRSRGKYAGGQSKERADSAQASPAWGHMSVTRGQFKRVGGTPGRSWKTVRGFKIIYTVTPGSDKICGVDDIVWNGAGSRALTGKFTVGYRWARKFTDTKGREIYTELSPMSPISDEITMQQQILIVTIPNAALQSKDAQANQLWVYLYGGWLDTYYRVARLPATINIGMTISDISMPNNFSTYTPPDDVYKLARLTSFGFSLTTNYAPLSDDLVATIYKSETEALVENEYYEAGATTPPKNIISIAGPWNKRMFVLTDDGWLWPSTQKSPSSFSVYHCIDLRQYGTPYWVAKTPSGVFVGMSKDIVRISGSGDNLEDGIMADLWGEPLNVANPPVDSSMCVDGNIIGYRSADGPMLFSGNSSSPLAFDGTSLLWRGETRHGVPRLNTEFGRFRYAADNHYIYMLAPEYNESTTDPQSVWRWGNGEWCRFTYPYTFLTIYREPGGALIAGTDGGIIVELETGNTDTGVEIPVNIETPYSDFGRPLARKDPADLHVHVRTGGKAGTITLVPDGINDNGVSVSFSTSINSEYRANILDLEPFFRVKKRITGDFSIFHLFGIGLSLTSRPNHVMVTDLGNILPSGEGDLAWINQVEIDVNATANLYLDVYKNGKLHSTETVAVTPNVRDVYTVVPARDSKARRIGLILRTSNANGEGLLGFELYSAKARHASTGNVTELPVGTGDDRSDV